LIKELVSRRTQAQQDRRAIEGGLTAYVGYVTPSMNYMHIQNTSLDLLTRAETGKSMLELDVVWVSSERLQASEGFELVVVASRAELAREVYKIN
jgi:hypothetical protein